MGWISQGTCLGPVSPGEQGLPSVPKREDDTGIDGSPPMGCTRRGEDRALAHRDLWLSASGRICHSMLDAQVRQPAHWGHLSPTCCALQTFLRHFTGDTGAGRAPRAHAGLRVAAPLQHGWLQAEHHSPLEPMPRQEGLPHGPHTPGPVARPRGALPWWPPSDWGHGWVGCQPPALIHGRPPRPNSPDRLNPDWCRLRTGGTEIFPGQDARA